MIGERMEELLGKAADAFEKGMNPFDHWFLSENEVTADECMVMSEQIAALIKWFVNQPRKTQTEILLHDLGPLAKEIVARVAYGDALRDANRFMADRGFVSGEGR